MSGRCPVGNSLFDSDKFRPSTDPSCASTVGVLTPKRWTLATSAARARGWARTIRDLSRSFAAARSRTWRAWTSTTTVCTVCLWRPRSRTSASAITSERSVLFLVWRWGWIRFLFLVLGLGSLLGFGLTWRCVLCAGEIRLSS